MEKIDLKAEMSEDDLKHFFSATHEYKVEKIKDRTFKIHYDNGLNGKMYNIIYTPTIQTLLRTIQGISYLEGYEQYERKLKREQNG